MTTKYNEDLYTSDQHRLAKEKKKKSGQGSVH